MWSCATAITQRARPNYANYIDDTNGCYSSSAPYLRNPTLTAWHLETLRLNLEHTLTEIYKNNTYQYMYLFIQYNFMHVKINPGMLL
jgi:hypothetical protein